MTPLDHRPTCPLRWPRARRGPAMALSRLLPSHLPVSMSVSTAAAVARNLTLAGAGAGTGGFGARGVWSVSRQRRPASTSRRWAWAFSRRPRALASAGHRQQRSAGAVGHAPPPPAISKIQSSGEYFAEAGGEQGGGEAGGAGSNDISQAATHKAPSLEFGSAIGSYRLSATSTKLPLIKINEFS